MLKVSKKQLAAFKSKMDADFHRKLCDFIAKEFSVPRDARQELEEGVSLAMEDARGFGFRTERGFATYTTAAFMCGHDFKKAPLVQRNLSSPTLSEGAKADWLTDWLIALEDALDGGVHVR